MRGADGLAANLQRIAGQAHMTDRARAAELHRPGSAEVVEDPAGAAGAVETGKCEHLAGHKPAGLVGIHHPGQGGHNHRTGRDGPQHQTRKHAPTPTYQSAGTRLKFLYPLLTIPTVATLEQLGW